MTGNLNVNSRGVIINVKEAQAHESTHAANVNFVATTITNSNVMMTTNYQKYVNDGLNQSVGSKIWKPHLHTLWRSGQFSDEDDITGVKLIDKDFHQFNEKTYEMNSIWI